MSWRREFSKFRALFGRNAASDVDDEIRAHIKMEESENLQSGMSQDEAHYAALRRFGNVAIAQESSRESWRWPSIDTLLQDVRFGTRQLRSNPGYTAIAILTLALGIGSTTAVFSLVNSVLLQPLPFHDSAQLVHLFETEVSPGEYPLSGADYVDWQAQNRTLAATSLYSWPSSMSASGTGEPESAIVGRAQANFFDVLGVAPLRGRAFAKGEDAPGKNRVAILSYGFWQRHFGGESDAVGKTLVLNGEPYTVVGIMPAWFRWSLETDLWTPIEMSTKELGPRGNHGWAGIGRLKKGVTLAQAQADLLGISKRLEKQFPDSNNNVHALVVPLKETLTGNAKTSLLTLLAAVSLVLLVACVNVANLQLARASTRHREMAVRASLGAGRFRLVRQMLTESLLLAWAGAALGTCGAWWCVALLQSVKSIPIPRSNPVQLDLTVLLFTVLVSVFAGLFFGLAPALQTSQSGLNEELKAGAQAVLSGARTQRLLRDMLVVTEISLTLALLFGAGLLLRSFAHLRNADIGVNTQNVLTTSISLPEAKYTTLASREQFFDSLIARAREISGVESAAISTEIPLQGGNNGYIHVDGATDPALANQLMAWNFITPDYFRTFGIPLVKGRLLSSADVDRAFVTSQTLFDLFKASNGSDVKVPSGLALVAVITQTAARTFWKNQDPVGRAFRWNDVKVTVIGIVSDVKEYGIRQHTIPQAYLGLPIALTESRSGHLTIKTRVPPVNILSALRKRVRELDSGLALERTETMQEVIAGDTADASLQASVLGAFALLALALAAIGLYGVMSYLVTQRTREIGIRMALGAKPSNVLGLILRHGLKLTIAGISVGAVAAFALSRWMSTLLYGVSPADPLTFGAVAGILASVALVAYYIPARRATKVDPVGALRWE